jgi:hypothetical protein
MNMRKGTHHSEETRRLISMKQRLKYAQGWTPRLGKHHTEETREKISRNRRGKCVGENNPFYGKHHTEEAKKRISEKRKGQFLVKPRLEMTPELAYVLGVLKGDGSVYLHRRGAIINLTTSSLGFAQSFSDALSKIGLKPSRIYGGKYYRVEAYSKAFHNWYKELTTAKLEEMLSNNDLIASFIRGFYESEGCCYKYSIHIYNTDYELIRLVRRLLTKLGFNFGVYIRKHNGGWGHAPLYTLFKNKKVDAQRFFQIIKPSIKLPTIGGTFSIGLEGKS